MKIYIKILKILDIDLFNILEVIQKSSHDQDPVTQIVKSNRISNTENREKRKEITEGKKRGVANGPQSTYPAQ
jgi:hypothetical protein